MNPAPDSERQKSRRAAVLIGVAGAAASMLALGGGVFLTRTLGGSALDPALAASLLLNLALLLFSWRTYAALRVEIGRRRVAETRLITVSLEDVLTGLRNRPAFMNDMAQALKRVRKRGQTGVLLLLDLDHFRTLNDVNGHALGDAVLQRTAALLRDIAPDDAVLARLGGDEFAAFISCQPGETARIEGLADQLLAACRERIEVGGATVHAGASLGLALADHDGGVPALMRRADIALYASKHAGRNRYHWFDAAMERELAMRNGIEHGIRAGVPLGQFVPHYEQQVDLATGRLLGFEMLARWEHPTRGLIGPDVFIPVAEEAGLISDLSMSVIRQAMEEARNWDPSLTLSVNIAPSQLRDPWFAHKVLKLLVETGFPGNRLEIEITEHALVENLGVAEQVVGSLKTQGIRIALDDFGTGSASLSNLRALPFDRVKIDRSFVTSLVGSAESAAVVNAITRLSDSLGLPVTVEGVETPEIHERLRAIGNFQAQGWHFGKPMDVSGVRQLLAERNLLPVARLAAPAGERVRELRRLG